MRNILPLGILSLVWILLTGSVEVQTMVLGLIVSSLSLLLFYQALHGRWIKQKHTSIKTDPTVFYKLEALSRLLVVLFFIPVFIGKVFLSGLQITRLAVTPGVSFWPGIVKITTDLPQLSSITAFATAITLTPGTLALDYDQQTDFLFIHWIDVSDYESATLDDQVTCGLRPWMKRMFP